MAVLKISIPVLLLDEILKFIARNYVDGKPESSAAKMRAIVSLFALGAVWCSYFCWMLGPYASAIEHALQGPVNLDAAARHSEL